MLRVKRLRASAVIPRRATTDSVGYDLSPAEDTVLESRVPCIVPTGIAVRIPDGYMGRISGRSSSFVKKNLTIAEGTVDPDYEGEVGIMVRNEGSRVILPAGVPIAQLILVKVSNEGLMMLVDDLHSDAGCTIMNSYEKSVRGTGGFGSTSTTQMNSSDRVLSDTENL